MGRGSIAAIPLCISSTTQAPDCKYLTDVSIACGNVILIDHGQIRS